MKIPGFIFRFLLILIIPASLPAQLYKTNIGVRLDESQFGVSLDQKIYQQFTTTAAFDAKSNEVKATAIARYHFKVLGRRLNIYPGLGAHWGVVKEYGDFSGFDLLIGAEYKLVLLPVVLSFDVNPAFHTAGHHPDWWNFQTVFSIKYVLVKDRAKFFERWRKKD